MVLEKLLEKGEMTKVFKLTRGNMELRVPKPMEYISFMKEYGDVMGQEGRSDHQNLALIIQKFSPDEDIQKATEKELIKDMEELIFPVDVLEIWTWFISLSGVMNKTMQEAMEKEDFRRRK